MLSYKIYITTSKGKYNKQEILIYILHFFCQNMIAHVTLFLPLYLISITFCVTS